MDFFLASLRQVGNMFTDPLSDMIARIKNACLINKQFVLVPASKTKRLVLDALASAGYIVGYNLANDDGGKPMFNVRLGYYKGVPVIRKIRTLSTSGRSLYACVRELKRMSYNISGDFIISTSSGVLQGNDAIKRGIGGKLICYIE